MPRIKHKKTLKPCAPYSQPYCARLFAYILVSQTIRQEHGMNAVILLHNGRNSKTPKLFFHHLWGRCPQGGGGGSVFIERFWPLLESESRLRRPPSDLHFVPATSPASRWRNRNLWFLLNAGRPAEILSRFVFLAGAAYVGSLQAFKYVTTHQKGKDAKIS